MKSAHTQHGKGLITFLAGSGVALTAIAAMLLMLNSNSGKTFKQPELAESRPAKPEVLSPGLSSQPQPPVGQSRPEPTPDPEPAPPPEEPAARPPVATARQPQAASAATAPPKPAVKTDAVQTGAVQTGAATSEGEGSAASKPAQPVQTAKPAPEPKPASPDGKAAGKTAPPAAKNDGPAELTEAELKPTAQQILDSGNIEKARETARKEALAKRAAREAAEKTAQAKAAADSAAKADAAAKAGRADKAKPAAAPEQAAKAKKGAASVQAGAFGNREAAEAHRAKLALMGVQTQVVAVESQGKKVYRVQTGKLPADKARQVQQSLKDQGVNSYTKQQ